MQQPISLTWWCTLSVQCKNLLIFIRSTSHQFWLQQSAAHMKGAFVSHRGAMQFATGCTAAECCRLQWNASAGRQAVLWKEDVAVLLLTSVAWIVLCCASRGFCSIICAHFITLFCRGLCALACRALCSQLMHCTGICFFCIYSSHRAVRGAFLDASTSENAPLCMPALILLLASSDTSAVKMLPQLSFSMLLRHEWAKQVFPLIIWTTSGHKAERRPKRTFILEGGRP